MINRFIAFFDERHGRPGGKDGHHTKDELHMAAACLLVHAASIDGHFDEGERRAIHDLAVTRLSLGEDEAATLIHEAAAKVGKSIQLLGFTRTIKDRFSYDERVELVEMLWEVVYTDGHADEFENQLMRRIGGLIYVDDRDRGLARKRVLQRRGHG